MYRIAFLLALLLYCTPALGNTFTVDSNADSDNALGYTPADGTNTLRKCVRLANTLIGLDTILFNLPGSNMITNSVPGGGGWFTLTDPVFMDGYSQPGASPGNPVVELNGNSVGKWYNIELVGGSSGSHLMGLIIYGTNIGVRVATNSDGNRVSGCWIGVDNSGNAPATNAIPEHGIRCENSSNNLIGGTGGLIDRNVIGACGQEGIRFEGISTNNTVQGNYIGVGRNGASDLGNRNGIVAQNMTGFVVGGGNPNAGNVISGNNERGIYLVNCDSFAIQGNTIGLTANALAQLSNNFSGIEGVSGSDNGLIGGTGTNEGNCISGNAGNGIRVVDCSNDTVKGNYIGVDGTGLTDLGNGQNGIFLINSPNISIGGLTRSSRNIISGNNLNGIALEGSSSNATIKANFIGIGVDGATVLKNDNNGIVTLGTANNMTIGGPTVPERNVISGNGQWVVNADPDDGIVGDGIRILGTDNHHIENNYIGTDSSGLIGIGNHWAGVSINDDSDSNLVVNNLISDNRNEGIWIYNGVDNTEIYGNRIGIAADGSPLGNWDFGIIISLNGTNSNTIGGSLANANTIAYTRGERPGVNGDGITVGGTAGDFNEITFNSIFCNAGEGILRLGTSNENIAPSVITASNPNDITGTGTTGTTIHVYRNTTTGPGCNCEGEIYVGSTTVIGGNWTLVHNLGLTPQQSTAVSATQTTPGNSTSQFAICSAPFPVEYLYFTGQKRTDDILLQWETASETDNAYFIVQASLEGLNFQEVGTVSGNGTTDSKQAYDFIYDAAISSTATSSQAIYSTATSSPAIYFRLIQVDQNGQRHESQVVEVALLDPVSSALQLRGNTAEVSLRSPRGTLTLYTIDGKMIREKSLEGEGTHRLDIGPLPKGVYLLRLNAGSEVLVRRFYLQP